jgi:multicomponent Na+:H+ antiporter subunit A
MEEAQAGSGATAPVRTSRGGRQGAFASLIHLPTMVSTALALWFLSLTVASAGAAGVEWSVPWLPAFDVALAFRLDGLSSAFALLVSGVGALVLLYATVYFKTDQRRPRLLLLLTLFEFAMLGLVLADDAITLFLFWEATTVISYLLVGTDHGKPEARAKALQALMVTGGGGLALLAGLIVLGDTAGTLRLSGINEAGSALRAAPTYGIALLLVLLGCFTKSAQVPFHFWLPNAMAAPTPVSAYLHSATMVKAGVYLLARLSPALSGTDTWVWTLTLVGGATMLLGAVWAVRQTDLKLMLAYTTVSGLGSLVMFIGSTVPVAIVAASTFLLVHAFYKAALFLTVGLLDKQAGTRDLAALGGLGGVMPVTWAIAVLAGFAMAGFPPLLGFIGKELKYEGALAVASEPLLVAGIAVLSNALLVGVGLVIALKPFIGQGKAPNANTREAPWPMLAGPLALALLGLAFGLAPEPVERYLVLPMATAILGGPATIELKLWHGVNVPLMLSVATFAIGLLVFWRWDWLRATLARVEPGAPRLERGYEKWLDWLKRGSAALTARVQTGRLGDYLRAMLGVLAVLLLLPALIGGRAPGVGLPSLSMVELAVLALTAAGALALPGARSRLRAVGALGIVGSGVALIFALYGAVDVAMTQLLVETLVVVILALALTRLPTLAPAQGQRPPRGSLAIAVLIGAGLTLSMLLVLATPLDGELGDWYAARAWPAAYGRNIVNVILVDFRALDTLGEIVVVAVAGVAGMILLRRSGRHAG